LGITQEQANNMVMRVWNDPQFHRTALKELPELHWPQLEVLEAVERLIAEGGSRTMTVRSARQTMKNETAAEAQSRTLWKFSKIGGVYLRVAPTWKPQIVNSKVRLERSLRVDPLILASGWKRTEGYIYEVGNAQIQFLSGDKTANVVGATASILLDIDEAHKIDRGKFDEEFSPMTAYYEAPTIMWGVAADQNDLLYEHREFNELHSPELNFQYPAEVWCEIHEPFRKHYEDRCRRLGEDHPIIRTQYNMSDMEDSGGYMKPKHRRALFNTDFERQIHPVEGKIYIAGVDIGGEDEDMEEDLFVQAENPERDSTICLIGEVDIDDIVNDWRKVKVVEAYQWTGEALGEKPSGLPGQQEKILQLFKHFNIHGGCVDARGVGEQIAGYLARRHKRIEKYKASVSSISDDCYDLLAMINNGQMQVFQNDDSPEYRELVRQTRWCKYGIRQHDQMYIYKPKRSKHIDYIKALMYLKRAAKDLFVTQYF